MSESNTLFTSTYTFTHFNLIFWSEVADAEFHFGLQT